MFGRHLRTFRPHVCQVRSLLKRANKFGNSFILLQDGPYVQELPVLVRHTGDHTFIMQNFGPNQHEDLKMSNMDGQTNTSLGVKIARPQQRPAIRISEDEHEFVQALERVERVRHIYSLLETASIQGVTPFVALKALQKIAVLESREEPSENDTNFARQAVIQKLMQTILEGDDHETLVNTFMFMKDLHPQGSLGEMFEELRKRCIDKAAAGKLSIDQTVRMVCALRSTEGAESKLADLLWQGIKINAAEIDETNVALVSSVLPLLRTSRRAVFRTLLQRLPHFWWKLSPDSACCLMEDVYRSRQGSAELCRMLSRWLALALHQLSETQLRVALAFFHTAEHCDDTLKRAAQKYCGARATSLSPRTVAALASFARHFNVRCERLLDSFCEHFVSEAGRYGDGATDLASQRYHLLRQDAVAVSDVAAVVCAVGELYHQPRNALQFFAAVEKQLKARFDQLPPEDILDMCLACVFVKRYPLNVVHQVFNLFFLEQLSGPDGMPARLRTKLSVLDSALTQECAGYRGPMLQRDGSARSLHVDRRAIVLAQKIQPLLETVDGVTEVVRGEPIPQLPLYVHYIPQLRCRRADGSIVSIFLNVPELYARDGTTLLGIAHLRRRLVSRLNMLPVDLPVLELSRLVVHPTVLRERIAQAVRDAEG